MTINGSYMLAAEVRSHFLPLAVTSEYAQIRYAFLSHDQKAFATITTAVVRVKIEARKAA